MSSLQKQLITTMSYDVTLEHSETVTDHSVFFDAKSVPSIAELKNIPGKKGKRDRKRKFI